MVARAIAYVRGTPPRIIAVRVPFELLTLAKSGGEFARLYHDQYGPYRWITVHPNGEDEPGVPVKIRPSKDNPDVWHVVGGAGGKLNYLKLVDLKSPEEWRRRAREREKARREKEKQRQQARQRELAELTDAERERAKEEERRKQEAAKALEQKRFLARQEMIAAAARAAGWPDEEWQFAATRKRLEDAGVDPKRIEKLEEAHWRRMEARVRALERSAKRRLLLDHEARAAAALNDVPLKSEDPKVVALSDLDPDTIEQGPGYARQTGQRSDAEITRQLAGRDEQMLAAEAEELRQQLDFVPPESAEAQEIAGKLAAVEAERRAAEVLKKAADMTPEEAVERDRKLQAAAKDVQQSIASYAAELAKLRRAAHTQGVTGEEAERLHELEDRWRQDHDRLEDIRRHREDLALVLGSAAAPVRGEMQEVARKLQAEREREIAATRGPEGVRAYRALLERMRAGMERYRAEMQALKQKGVLRPPQVHTSAADLEPDKAVEVLRAVKRYKAAEKEIGKALKSDTAEEMERALYGKPAMVAARDERLDAQIQREIEQDIAQIRTSTFLRELSELDERDPVLRDIPETKRRRALERYVATGSYNALNEAAQSILGGPALSRDVADTLGAAAAAQLLAAAIRSAYEGDELAAVRDAVGDYHLAHHMELSEEALRRANELYEQAREIELGAAETSGDLATLQELNAKRRAALLEARRTLGEALGQMEATAALHWALRGKTPETLNVPLGPVGREAAIRQLRALGLDRGEYEIISDGRNLFASIRTAAALAKLIRHPDPQEVRLRNEIRAIKAGHRDEDGWLPPGIVSRPRTWFEDKGQEAEKFAPLLRSERPFSTWGSGGRSARQDLDELVGAMAADGHAAGDILRHVLDNLPQVPEAARSDVLARLNELMPTHAPATDKQGRPIYRRDPQTGEVLHDEQGKPIPELRLVTADHWQPRLNALAEKFVASRYGRERAAFHAQGLRIDTPEDARKTALALHQAVAEDPRVLVAWKPPGELTAQEQAAIRHYFATEIAGHDPKHGVDRAEIDKRLQELGPEPPRETDGLFGRTTNPEWAEWQQRRQAILAEAVDDSSQWRQFVETMHGTHRAYRAVQDLLRGDLLRRFARTYQAVHGEPLKVGKRTVAHAERLVAFQDPDRHQQWLRELRQIQDRLRARVRGKYAEGSIKEKVDRALQEEEILRQNTASLFGEQRDPDTIELRAGERLAIGERAENQVASLLPNIAANFSYALTQPIELTPDIRMSGRAKIKGADVDLSAQQRAIKMFLARKRMVAALGTGSGKTPIAIGAFTAAASDPKTGVKRGLFVVRSNNLGQFHGEFHRFADPTRFRWYANPAASGEERLAAHRDPSTHAVVVTHESLRDDTVRLLAEQWGTTTKEAARRFMRLGRRQRAAAVREAWQRSGIDYQAAFVDEGHVTLDRRGKPDSLLSAVVTAVTDNTPYYMASTADPLKNDISEIRSQLDKLHPDGRYSDERAWQQRYGVHTVAAAEALREEVEPHFFTHHIQPPVERQHREVRVQLTQAQRAAYRRVEALADRVRLGLMRGQIDVHACRELSPKSFEGVPKEHELEVARRVSEAVGTIRDGELHRIVNQHEQNAKVQAVREMLRQRDTRKHPVVIFAHNPSVVERLERELRADGHRVVAVHGGHSTQEKDRRRRMFQPDSGEPQADVIVLSDAGATGLNLQRGQTLIQYDVPMTAMMHAQRNGRIDRLGQNKAIELVDLVTDTDFEERARQRVARKYELRSIFTDGGGEARDDSSLGAFIERELHRRRQLAESQGAKLAA